MGWVDIVLLSILAVSVIVGLVRGLVFEVLSLIGWVVAFALAAWAGPDVAARLPLGTPGSGLNLGAALAITFLATMLVWGLCARLLRSLVRASPLSGIDRVLGAGFGALRGFVLLVLVAFVAALTPVRFTQDWQHSQGAMWLNGVLQEFRPALPQEVVRLFPA